MGQASWLPHPSPHTSLQGPKQGSKGSHMPGRVMPYVPSTPGPLRGAQGFVIAPQFRKAEDNSMEEGHSESWAISVRISACGLERAPSSMAEGSGPLMHIVCSCQQGENEQFSSGHQEATVPH